MYRVAFATGSRADYGIVRNYLKFLNEDANIDLSILVTGSLLDDKYGKGIDIIEEDGFKIATTVDIDLDTSSNKTIINTMSIALKGFGDYFYDNKYDLLIVLGDRYEMLSVSIAAAMQRIPILHIHGGEITYGNYDEFIRHSITKMSMYHFTSTEVYKNRVIQLGEEPERVFNIGAMGSENCKVIIKNNVIDDVKLLKDDEYFVVLFHPETLTDVNVEEQMEELLFSIDNFINKYKFVFIGSNADTGADVIRGMIASYVNNNMNALYFENLHPDSFHYLVKNSFALVGNSSSGIIEVPSLNTYTVNIGDRQKGRQRGNSVIDTECKKKSIISSLNFILSKPNIVIINPYYKEQSSKNAHELTKKVLGTLKKEKIFFDLFGETYDEK